MTTVAALVTLGLAFTAPASRLAPPRVSSARMMCAAVMPETPPALESDCGFDHVPLSIALQSGDFLEARPPGPPATTHTACPRHTSVRVNLLFYTGRIESSLALNPRSRRIVSSTPRNRSILCTIASTHARNPTSSRTKSSSAPKVTGDAYDYYQRARNPSKV